MGPLNLGLSCEQVALRLLIRQKNKRSHLQARIELNVQPNYGPKITFSPVEQVFHFSTGANLMT